jgi:hypothetical protein
MRSRPSKSNTGAEAAREWTTHVSRPRPNTRKVTTRHYARKRFGQHFLERQWADKVLDKIAARPDEVLIEVGPGRGALTHSLVEHVHRLVAIEIDRSGCRPADVGRPNLVVHKLIFFERQRLICPRRLHPGDDEPASSRQSP